MKLSPMYWLRERLPIDETLAFLHKKTVPRHKHSFWYIFGGLSLFFFIIQIVTGVLLLFYYSPTPETAHESVQFLITKVPFGWVVRSIHAWSANLMIACVLLHFFSTFLMKSYRKPRELMWITGVVQLMIVLGFGFTGYLLPWDTTAYFATKVGTEIPGTIPYLGTFAVNILRGGEFVGAETLKRLFALHVVALPLVMLAFVGAHLLLVQRYGNSVPIGTKVTKSGIPFYPNYVYRDSIAWTFGFMVLAALVLLVPRGLDVKADITGSAPPGIKPEWYFLSLYQTLKVFPAALAGISGDTIVNILVLCAGAFLFLVPFLDRKASREEPSKLFTVFGIIAALYLTVMTIWAYLT